METWNLLSRQIDLQASKLWWLELGGLVVHACDPCAGSSMLTQLTYYSHLFPDLRTCYIII